MARYTGPKNRIARREGTDLGLKTIGSHAHASMLRRLGIAPGMHGQKGKKKISDYGSQLREKQKVKRMYGVFEKQFRRVFEKAKKFRGNTGDQLVQFLERRLDNVIYRLALAPTRSAARQIITHGHIMVDGKRHTIPSYMVEKGTVISLDSTAASIPYIKKMVDEKTPQVPAWVERKGPAGKVIRLPERLDVQEDISEQLIIEYYSR